MVACAVLSGNRNFEGRIHPQVKMNYLASPPLVVAYALAGNMKIDITKEPLGKGKDGKPVYLKDIWPTSKEVHDLIATHVDVGDVQDELRQRVRRRRQLEGLKSPTARPHLGRRSTYMKNPPYFEGMTLKTGRRRTSRARACWRRSAIR